MKNGLSLPAARVHYKYKSHKYTIILKKTGQILQATLAKVVSACSACLRPLAPVQFRIPATTTKASLSH
jgi:hypothetical protein